MREGAVETAGRSPGRRRGCARVTLEPIAVPDWQVAVVLVGFPIAYLLNDFNPWSRRLVREGDRSHYLEYWSTIVVVHWSSAVVVGAILATNGYGPADVGLVGSGHPFVLALSAGIAAVALGWYGLGVLARKPIPIDALSMPVPGVVVPRTLPERLFQLFGGGVTAGFCEEVVYRGFAVLALLGAGFPWWAAVPISSLAFVFVHGFAPLLSPVTFAKYFGFGVGFALVFLLSETLVLPVAAHFGYNLVTFARSTAAVLERTNASNAVQ